MRTRKFTGLLAAGGLIAALAATPAGADPKKGDTFGLECDNGQSYVIAVNGNGDFTPGHLFDSTAVIVPLSFNVSGTVTDAGGTTSFNFSKSKGQPTTSADDIVTCTFGGSGSEDAGATTFTFSGTVTGFITPRKKS